VKRYSKPEATGQSTNVHNSDSAKKAETAIKKKVTTPKPFFRRPSLIVKSVLAGVIKKNTAARYRRVTTKVRLAIPAVRHQIPVQMSK
jgi:ribosomal protein S20